MAQDDPLLEQLSAASARYREARRLRDEALAEPRRVMEEAFACCITRGYTYREIGKAMGLSRQEVHRRRVSRGLEQGAG